MWEGVGEDCARDVASPKGSFTFARADIGLRHREVRLKEQGVGASDDRRQPTAEEFQRGNGETVVESGCELQVHGDLAALASSDPNQLMVGVYGVSVIDGWCLADRKAIRQDKHAS